MFMDNKDLMALSKPLRSAAIAAIYHATSSHSLDEPPQPFHEREHSHEQMKSLQESHGFEILVIKGGNRGVYIHLPQAREILFYICRKVC